MASDALLYLGGGFLAAEATGITDVIGGSGGGGSGPQVPRTPGGGGQEIIALPGSGGGGGGSGIGQLAPLLASMQSSGPDVGELLRGQRQQFNTILDTVQAGQDAGSQASGVIQRQQDLITRLLNNVPGAGGGPDTTQPDPGGGGNGPQATGPADPTGQTYPENPIRRLGNPGTNPGDYLAAGGEAATQAGNVVDGTFGTFQKTGNTLAESVKALTGRRYNTGGTFAESKYGDQTKQIRPAPGGIFGGFFGNGAGKTSRAESKLNDFARAQQAKEENTGNLTRGKEEQKKATNQNSGIFGGAFGPEAQLRGAFSPLKNGL